MSVIGLKYLKSKMTAETAWSTRRRFTFFGNLTDCKCTATVVIFLIAILALDEQVHKRGSNRVLSLLSELVEKLNLLASILVTSIDAEASHTAIKAQRMLLSRLEKRPACLLESQVRIYCLAMQG